MYGTGLHGYILSLHASIVASTTLHGSILKGLSHEIDFDNVDENGQM